jgi:dTDP-4-amino-4,6-dideoxygalactose transaminase
MTRLPDIVEARRTNARRLSDALTGVEGLVVPSEPLGRRHVFHQFTLRVTRSARMSRDGLLEHLMSRRIQAGIYYPRPVFDYGCFRRDPRVGTPMTPRTVEVAGEVLSLPVHPGLTEEDLSSIVEPVREDFYGTRRVSPQGRGPTVAAVTDPCHLCRYRSAP